jgi:Domain of unknown function (DUF4832)/Beta-galactosidase
VNRLSLVLLTGAVSLFACSQSDNVTDPNGESGDDDSALATQWQTVRPPTSDGPDKNPLKGWNSGWWNNHDFASVGFQYLSWNEFEPENNRFDWNAVEAVINREGSRGRHTILRFFCDWESKYAGPAWLLNTVARQQSGSAAATDYNDPDFIREASEAIQALTNHYKNDPRMFVFELGTVGWWGEWHTAGHDAWAPSDKTKQTILDVYKNSVGGVLLQARYPWDSALTGRTSGLGYHNDFFSTDDHSRSFDRAIAAGGLWKQGPIGGEWPPDRPAGDFTAVFNSPLGEQFIREGHYSTMQLGGAEDVISKWKDGFYKLHRLMGYNFQVREVKYAVPTGGQGSMPVRMQIANTGITNFYKNWGVQLALLDDTGRVAAKFNGTNVDIRTWNPGQTYTISASQTVKLDPSRKYRIALRILQPNADANKATAWGLDARNVYVVLANKINVIQGSWNSSNALQGGWNILANL